LKKAAKFLEFKEIQGITARLSVEHQVDHKGPLLKLYSFLDAPDISSVSLDHREFYPTDEGLFLTFYVHEYTFFTAKLVFLFVFFA